MQNRKEFVSNAVKEELKYQTGRLYEEAITNAIIAGILAFKEYDELINEQDI